MLQAITRKKEIRSYQAILAKHLQNKLKSSGKYILGFQGDNFEQSLRFNKHIWWGNFRLGEEEKSPRYWNGFGVLPFKETGTQDITVEINIPLEGINRKVSGLFALDHSTGDVFLLHRGRVGGGRPGIGKETFKSWYRGGWVEFVEEEGFINDAVLITSIYSNKALAQIHDFVKQVKQFKDEISGNSLSRNLSDSAARSIKSNILSFDPEFAGTKKGKRKSIFRQECIHGHVVNGLEEWLRTKDENQDFNTFNNQLVDLGTEKNNKIIALYEVKTNIDRQSIYTGIGQLLFHTSGIDGTSKFLVVPRLKDKNELIGILSNLGIQLIEYQLKNNIPVFYK